MGWVADRRFASAANRSCLRAGDYIAAGRVFPADGGRNLFHHEIVPPIGADHPFRD